MSPVNCPRSTGLARFPRSRLATLFLVKFRFGSYEKPGSPGYRDLGLCDRDPGNRDEKYSIKLHWWTLQPGWPAAGRNIFWQNSSIRYHNIAAEMARYLSCKFYHFSGSSKVTMQESTKPYNSHECWINEWMFMFHHFGFVSWLSSQSTGIKFPIWTKNNIHSYSWFLQVTEPARLPNSFEEALNTRKREKTMTLILFF